MPDLFPNEEWKPYAGPDGAVFRLPDSVAKNIPGLVPAPSADPMNQVDYGNAGGDGHAFGYTYDPKNLPAIPAGEGAPIDYDPNDTSNMVPIGAPQIAGVGASPATKQRLASNLGPKNTGVLNLQQATGPVGTIGQINQPLASPAAPGGYATQADFDAATNPPADAVSGAGTAAQQQATEPAPLTADTLRDMGPAGVANQQQAALADEADAARAAADTQAKYQLQIADATVKRNEEIDKQIAERAKAAEDQSRRIDARMTEYDAAAKKYADFKPDRSIDHPILAAISVALGAIGGVIKNDGTNPALDMLMKQIDRKAQLQMQDLGRLKDVAAGKRGDIDLLRQRASDKTAQYNLAIAGETEKAARQMEAIAARLTSETAKQDAAIKIAQLRQRAAAAVGDAVGAQMAKDERDRAFEEQKRNDRARIGLAYKADARADREFEWNKEFQSGQLAQKAQELAQKGNAKTGELVMKQGVPAPPTAVTDADGNVTLKRDGLLTQADGRTPFIVPTEKEAQDLRAKLIVANRLVDILDEVRSIRDRVGGESSWGNSDEYQRLQVLKENLVGLKKSGTQGMSSDADMARLEKMLGADNPASFRAQAAKLDEGREQVVKQANAEARGLGYTGKDLVWTDPVKAQRAAATPEEKAFKQVLKDPFRSGVDVAADLGVPPGQVDTITAVGNAYRANGGMTNFQKQTLDMYAAQLGDPKNGAKAREYLAKAAQSAQTKGVKDYASQLLVNSASANFPTSPETINAPSTATARDTSKGGPAQTMTEQKQNDAMRANVMQSMPLSQVVQGAETGDVPSRQELARRAGAGDKQAQAAALRIVQAKR